MPAIPVGAGWFLEADRAAVSRGLDNKRPGTHHECRAAEIRDYRPAVTSAMTSSGVRSDRAVRPSSL